MPHPLLWTQQRDSAIRAMRTGGQSWDRIATHLGISRWAAIERAKLIGTHMPTQPRPRPDPAAEALADPDRLPLAPGHPLAWAVITDGTLLAGTAYPFPVSAGHAATRQDHAA